MSLYNMLFGKNPISAVLLGMLNLSEEDVGRFRDAYLSEGEIVVYTRNGGGNRSHWGFTYNEHEEGESCPCPGCIVTYKLPKHPNYIRDEDDDFDSTYATVYFSMPDEYKDLVKVFESGEFDPDKRWGEKFEEMRSCSKEELEQKYPEIVKSMKDMLKKLDKGESGIVEV